MYHGSSSAACSGGNINAIPLKHNWYLEKHTSEQPQKEGALAAKAKAILAEAIALAKALVWFKQHPEYKDTEYQVKDCPPIQPQGPDTNEDPLHNHPAEPSDQDIRSDELSLEKRNIITPINEITKTKSPRYNRLAKTL